MQDISIPDVTQAHELFEWFVGDLAFDIGANIGQSAASLSSRFTHVVSCEPAAESYSVLLSSVPSNVFPLFTAISDVNGEVELNVQEHPIKSGQLTTGNVEHWGKVLSTRKVPSRTLDSLSDEYGDPDFVKIDTEGHEQRVVASGLTMLGRARPRLYIEVHDVAAGSALQEILRPWYGRTLQKIASTGYRPGEWGFDNHYWLVTA